MQHLRPCHLHKRALKQGEPRATDSRRAKATVDLFPRSHPVSEADATCCHNDEVREHYTRNPGAVSGTRVLRTSVSSAILRRNVYAFIVSPLDGRGLTDPVKDDIVGSYERVQCRLPHRLMPQQRGDRDQLDKRRPLQLVDGQLLQLV